MMNANIKRYYLLTVLFVFMILPLMLFNTGDFPQRTFLKESISIVVILSFFLLLGQFFLSRTNKSLIDMYKMSKIIKIHKIIGYSVVTIFLVHPFFIVVPRFFEAGVTPLEAMTKILTTFDNIGIVVGMVAWCLMLILGITSFFRDKLPMKYVSWRIFHGVLAMLLLILALWHSMELGRHTDLDMAIFMILLAGIGLVPLLKVYLLRSSNKNGEVS